ncbi:hypothetical protein COP2_010757 [Malus domestica]
MQANVSHVGWGASQKTQLSQTEKCSRAFHRRHSTASKTGTRVRGDSGSGVPPENWRRGPSHRSLIIASPGPMRRRFSSEAGGARSSSSLS